MTPPNIYYSALLLFAGIACLVVAILIGQQRRTAVGAGSLILLMLALTWWDTTYAIFWAGVPGPNPFFWLDITYMGVVIVPTVFLTFIIQFSQLEGWLKPPFLLALAIEPILVMVLMWTDSWHGLFFAGKRAENTGMILNAGPIVWVNIIYSYLLILLACVLLIQYYRRSSGLYRRQAMTVLLAVGFPWLNSIIFILGLSPLPNADNTPFAFSATALIIAYALLRYRLLDVVPIARHVLVENMSDGVLVLDAQNRIVDINPAAQNLLGNAHQSPVGEPVEKVFAPWSTFATQFYAVSQAQTEIAIGDPPERYLDLRISPLSDPRGHFVGRLIVWREITELKRAQAELEKFATTDMLTQIFNRRHFLELAEVELKRAKRLHLPLTLLLIDIDNFKQINDTFGHAAGDQILTAFATLFREHIREIDLFARFGGEEFVAFVTNTGHVQAFQVAERLRIEVAQTKFEFGTHQISITCSFGVAPFANDQDTLEMLLHKADQALYAAKKAGRNCVVIWDAALEP